MQVEMVSTDAKDMVEVRYILSLREETLSSELTVSNLKSSSIQMRGGIISHLTVSTPEATFAYGLEGSDFYNRPVFLSNFGIVPPDLSQKRGFGSGQLWGNLGLNGFLTGWDARNQKNGDKGNDSLIESEEMEGEENDNYKNLTQEMSRIYTSAPRDFTIIDRVLFLSTLIFNNSSQFKLKFLIADTQSSCSVILFLYFSIGFHIYRCWSLTNAFLFHFCCYNRAEETQLL